MGLSHARSYQSVMQDKIALKVPPPAFRETCRQKILFNRIFRTPVSQIRLLHIANSIIQSNLLDLVRNPGQKNPPEVTMFCCAIDNFKQCR